MVLPGQSHEQPALLVFGPRRAEGAFACTRRGITNAAPNPTSTHENAGEAARETPAQVTAAQIASPETAPLIAPAQGASAEVGFTEPSFGEDATAIDFAARWPDLPKSVDLNARGPEMMSNIYTEGQADTREQIPLMLSHSVGMVAFRTAFVANTLWQFQCCSRARFSSLAGVDRIAAIIGGPP